MSHKQQIVELTYLTVQITETPLQPSVKWQYILECLRVKKFHGRFRGLGVPLNERKYLAAANQSTL